MTNDNGASFDLQFEYDLSVCPFCGSTNFDDYKDESGDDLHTMTFRWKCLDCNNEWHEEWKFNRRIEMNEDGAL